MFSNPSTPYWFERTCASVSTSGNGLYTKMEKTSLCMSSMLPLVATFCSITAYEIQRILCGGLIISGQAGETL